MRGTLDVAFVPLDLEPDPRLRLLPLERVVIDALIPEFPFVRPIEVSATELTDQAVLTLTVGVDGLLICRADLPEEIAYLLVQGFFDSREPLVTSFPPLIMANIEDASATPIPLHVGAARYYREREVFGLIRK